MDISTAKNRKVLCIAVPQVPHYVNAGHSLAIFEIAAYLRNKLRVQAMPLDASKGDVNWMDLARTLHKEQFDIIAIQHDLGASFEGLRQFIKYSKEISPQSKLILFGRQVVKYPKFYQRYGTDAIVESGDYEAGVASFIGLDGSSSMMPKGISLRTAGGEWMRAIVPGIVLRPEEISLPDINEINYAAYDLLYQNDENKFCGIPDRRELVVPVARGCPIGCKFCEVWQREGKAERRQSVSRVINYIEESFKATRFEYVSFYAPTFTLRKNWVVDLCNELIKRGSRYPWKCTTALPFLSEDLVALMAKSGCKRISVGLETLGNDKEWLPEAKRVSKDKFTEVIGWCNKYGIELNCFVILGLPRETIKDMEYTAQVVRDSGARYRPTTLERKLNDDENLTEEIISFNAQRRFFKDLSEAEVRRLNVLLFGETRTTRVIDKIPKKEVLHQIESGEQIE